MTSSSYFNRRRYAGSSGCPCRRFFKPARHSWVKYCFEETPCGQGNAGSVVFACVIVTLQIEAM